jgi:NADH-quinone oxidoreductase subunit N
MTDYLTILKHVSPEVIVLITSLVVLFCDLSFMRTKPLKERMFTGAAVSAAGCSIAFLSLFTMNEAVNLQSGMWVSGSFTSLIKQALLLLMIFTAFISADATFTDHAGEYFAILLIATLGMMLMISTEHILMVFLALELSSLSLYILTAFNKQNIRSSEAALKYFLFGGMSASFLLFGLSLIYGISGEAVLPEIAVSLAEKEMDVLMIVAIVMVIIGFGFKVAAVPFHLWAPDAYQGAPTSSTALIATGSKIASFFLMAKFMMVGLAGLEGQGSGAEFRLGWAPVIAIMALLSMVLGNLAAITQKNVKRLLAFSAVAHAGYALLALFSKNEQGMASLMFYMVTYSLAVVGAFAVISIVEDESGDALLDDFKGLARRSPWVSFCMLVFILSLAGIPPLAGFFGKFYVFVAALDSDPENLGLLWLVVVAVAMSAVSLYYYLQVLKQIYVIEADNEKKPLQIGVLAKITIGGCAILTLLLGCAPDPQSLHRLRRRDRRDHPRRIVPENRPLGVIAGDRRRAAGTRCQCRTEEVPLNGASG